MIEAAGVVVPAHNEQDLLPSCLAAIRQAAGLAGVPVHLVVVADGCTDRTAQRARNSGATVLRLDARNVGAARRAGAGHLLRRTRHVHPAAVWLATTDADTIVPRCWLTRQLRYASQGWEAVIGTVTVLDWAGHPPFVPLRFSQQYQAWYDTHPHVHGANLGFTAAAYLAAGGFRALATGEDHALVRDLTAAGRRLLRTTALPVVTSARPRARAPRGFAWLLGTLSAAQQAVPGAAPEQEPA